MGIVIKPMFCTAIRDNVLRGNLQLLSAFHYVLPVQQRRAKGVCTDKCSYAQGLQVLQGFFIHASLDFWIRDNDIGFLKFILKTKLLKSIPSLCL